MSRTPIADHAYLSDCRSAALLTRDGSIDWLCLPRFDSAAVFARLLDEGAGYLSLRPLEEDAVAERQYVPESLVLQTTWTCPSGTVTVRDALALGQGERGHELGLASPGVLLRHVHGESGTVSMGLVWAPRPEFGLVHPHLREVAGGVRSHGGSSVLMLSVSAPVRIEGSTAIVTVDVHAGKDVAFALEQASAWKRAPRPWSTARITRRLRDTERAWASWSQLHQHYDGPLRELVHRSGLVLQGLTYARSGAIIAAATTSLPEGEGSGRTWDYRFAWVRDASMTMRGLWVAACPDEAARFFAFLARAAGTQLERGHHLQIMFGLGGERDLSERELPHLSGWRDSGPVRVGNGAWNQHQQDIYGALLDAAFVLREQLDPLQEVTQKFLISVVEAAAQHWPEPDQGLWEVRGPARRYLHSALMCWVALDRGISLASLIGAQERVPDWTRTREEIREAILTQGWNETLGSFTQTLGGDQLDASTLLMATSGILEPEDARMSSTIDAIVAALGDEQGLLFRYHGEDGLDGQEGTFLLCTFWLVEALAVTGRPDEAERVLLRAAAHGSDLGLLAEQVSRDGPELLGNYPQAFSHLGLVLAAQALADARQRQARVRAPS